MKELANVLFVVLVVLIIGLGFKREVEKPSKL